jgi:hypothetical protein
MNPLDLSHGPQNVHTARLDASILHFPPQCIRCGGHADTDHKVTVSRGIDLIFVAYWRLLDVPIPVCRACKRHRRIVGVLCWTGLPLAVLALGFFGFALAINEWSKAGAVAVLSMMVVLALFGRFKLDHAIEWKTLGVRLIWKKGPGTPFEVRFRRPEYFAAWAAVNPGAMSAGAANAQPAPAFSGGPEDPLMQNVDVFDRKMPALLFVGLTAALALHHWYAVTNNEVSFTALFLLPMVWMLALAGMFYPPVMYSIGKYGKDLPVATKVAGAVIALSGLGLGFCLAKFVYGMF